MAEKLLTTNVDDEPVARLSCFYCLTPATEITSLSLGGFHVADRIAVHFIVNSFTDLLIKKPLLPLLGHGPPT